MDWSNELEQGLCKLAVEATDHQKKQLNDLLVNLLKWNKSYNLTAITDPSQALTLHLLDSLAVFPYIKQPRIIDVGTGAGFPGLPLAIMLPEVSFSLLDSNSKKIRFIRQIIHQLDLDNVEAIHSRVEQHKFQYDGVISRAFASLEDMINLTQHLLSPSGVWLAMKGVYSKEEVLSISDKAVETACYKLEVPNLSAERCLIELVSC